MDKSRDQKVRRQGQCDQEHEGVNRGRGHTQGEEQNSSLTRRRELWVWKCRCREFISELHQAPREDETVARVNSLRRDYIGAGSRLKACRDLIMV